MKNTFFGGYNMPNNDYKFAKNSVFLITGGAGFIGSHICEELVNMGYKVRCLDNFSTGKKENIEHLLNKKNFELIVGDICDLNTCINACLNVDYVSHQAAWGSVPKSIKLPLDYEKINIMGSLNMLQAAALNKVKRFVYASSSSVYGDDKNLLKIENKVGSVLSPYALTKKTVEEYGRLYNNLYDLETIGLRYFNVFGPRQDCNSKYSAVIPVFIKNLLENKKIIINGDGTQSRDFTYVKNVVQANLKAMLAPSSTTGEVFNIACGDSIAINSLFSKIALITKSQVKPSYGPIRKGDIKDSKACITKAKKLLGYNPNYNLDDGLEFTIKWYQKKI